MIRHFSPKKIKISISRETLVCIRLERRSTNIIRPPSSATLSQAIPISSIFLLLPAEFQVSRNAQSALFAANTFCSHVRRAEREKTSPHQSIMKISCIRNRNYDSAETRSIARRLERPSRGGFKKDKNQSELISKLDTVDKNPTDPL